MSRSRKSRSLMPALLLALALLGILAAAPLTARDYLLLFGSDSCEECGAFKKTWSATAAYTDPLLVYISIDTEEGYQFLRSLEEALPPEKAAEAFPVFLAGPHWIQGAEALQNSPWDQWVRSAPKIPMLAPLEQSMANAERETLISWTPPASSTTPVLPEKLSHKGPVALLYLASPGCAKCARQERELMRLKEVMPSLSMERYDFSTVDGQVMMERVKKHFLLKDTEENLTPLVAWSNGLHHGSLATAEELLASLVKAPGDAWWRGAISESERQQAIRHGEMLLEGVTWTMVLSAGLLDGINPCAFATIIFLISYLLYLKRSRSFVLVVGSCFCLGVFLSYFLYGLSLGFLVDQLNRFFWAKTLLYCLFGLAGVAFFLLHLRDTLKYRETGKVTDLEMGLGADTHRKIHDKIHAWAKLPNWLAIPAAICLGCLVSAMELACTGQVYLPTIAAIFGKGGLQPRVLWMLTGYNLAFLVPLLGVTLAAFWGTGATSLAAWARKHLLASKAAMTLLFLAMALLMFFLAFRG